MRKNPGLIALLATCLAGPAAAQSAYDVEVVVFEHIDGGASDSERWRPEVVVPPIADAAAFDASGPRGDRLQALPDGFERLGMEESQLGDALERLRDSNRYRVLRHSIWRQPALGTDEAVALRFNAGEPTAVRIPAHAYPAGPIEAETDAASAADDRDQSRAEADNATVPRSDGLGSRSQPRAPGSAARTYLLESPFGVGMVAPPLRDADVLPLDGTVKLVVSRYLHLHADLYYTAAVEWSEERDDDQIAATGPDTRGAIAPPRSTRVADGRNMLSYGFHQQRRMRSGELHYLDHPVLGLLVKVTPHEGGSA